MILTAGFGSEKIIVLICLAIIVVIALFYPRSALKLNIDSVSRMRVSYNGPEGNYFQALDVDENFDVIYYLLENGFHVTAIRRGRGEPGASGWYTLEIYDADGTKIKQLWFNEGREFFEWNSKSSAVSKNITFGKKQAFDVEYYRDLLGMEEK